MLLSPQGIQSDRRIRYEHNHIRHRNTSESDDFHLQTNRIRLPLRRFLFSRIPDRNESGTEHIVSARNLPKDHIESSPIRSSVSIRLKDETTLSCRKRQPTIIRNPNNPRLHSDYTTISISNLARHRMKTTFL